MFFLSRKKAEISKPEEDAFSQRIPPVQYMATFLCFSWVGIFVGTNYRADIFIKFFEIKVNYWE